MKLGIVGSRKRDSMRDKALLRQRILVLNPEVIISGGCPRGADRFAEELAEELGIPIKIHYPEISDGASYWERIRAYYARNQKIAEDSDYLIALVSKSRKGGTEDTIRRFLKLGKSDLEIW